MTKVWRVGTEANQRLETLGLDPDDLLTPIDLAIGDARSCTALDAPSASAFIFWSRLNRYFREGVKPKQWLATNADQILRAINPTRDFALTAVSGSGAIGDPHGKVRTKNPKGAAFASLVKVNSRLFGPSPQPVIPGLRLASDDAVHVRASAFADMPLWVLLYRRHGEELHAELSLPTDINCKTVAEWEERIMLEPVPYPGGPNSLDIFLDEEEDQDDLDIAVDWR
ncbi:hypothetical protein [Micromonospora sp. NPDC049374]|uniref:hypothetical protein n=1 Tax=Micromonospora sp. NPDC049374 TaxID=3154352 RepID=UPI00344A8487